jgi:hypothetical protein
MLWCVLLCCVLQGEGAPASAPGVVKGPPPSPLVELAELVEPIDMELLAESEVDADTKARNEAKAAREAGFDCVSVATDNMGAHSQKHQ